MNSIMQKRMDVHEYRKIHIHLHFEDELNNSLHARTS